jgi:hypothetical protein
MSPIGLAHQWFWFKFKNKCWICDLAKHYSCLGWRQISGGGWHLLPFMTDILTLDEAANAE